MNHVVDKQGYLDLLALLEKCGMVVSVFLKPKPALKPERDGRAPFLALFQLPEFQANSSEIGDINLNEIQFSILNRLELEGSIASIIANGGCHGSTKDIPLEKIKSSVVNGLEAAFPEPFSSVIAFRLDNQSWCSFTDSATLSASYLVYEGARGLWWLLCVADFD